MVSNAFIIFLWCCVSAWVNTNVIKLFTGSILPISIYDRIKILILCFEVYYYFLPESVATSQVEGIEIEQTRG